MNIVKKKQSDLTEKPDLYKIKRCLVMVREHGKNHVSVCLYLPSVKDSDDLPECFEVEGFPIERREGLAIARSTQKALKTDYYFESSG